MKMPFNDADESKFNMAPMIDMVFLLLIFFMYASRISVAQSKELNVPRASSARVPRDRPDRLIVNIPADGNYYIGQTRVSLDELRAIAREHQTRDPETKIYLRGDQDAEFRNVQRVMNAMAELGIDDFIFGTYVPDG